VVILEEAAKILRASNSGTRSVNPPISPGLVQRSRTVPMKFAFLFVMISLAVAPGNPSFAEDQMPYGQLPAAMQLGKGAEYFVAPHGDDGGFGNAQSPWRTLQKACESVEAGATVTVLPGVYREMIYVEVEGSAEAGPVTIRAAGEVIIDVSELADAEHIFYIEDRSYLTIAGFQMRGLTTNDGSGIRFQGSGSHLQFRDNKIHGMRGKNAMGITVYGTDAETPITDLLISGNQIYDCEAAPSEALVINGNIDGFEISRNYVADINNIGIDMIGGERDIVDDPQAVVRNGVCRANKVMRARSSYGGGFAAGIYVDGGRDIIIESNVVSQCDMGIEVGAENKGLLTRGIVVRNNFLKDNDKAGLVFGGYGKAAGRVESCQFLNNYIANNTSHAKAQAEIWIQWASNNLVSNNIVVGSASEDVAVLAFEAKGDLSNSLDYNRWYHPAGSGQGNDRFVWKGKAFDSLPAFQNAIGQDLHSSWGDPNWDGPDQPVSLQSPCIDAGDPDYQPEAKVIDAAGRTRVLGGRVDIGPLELR